MMSMRAGSVIAIAIVIAVVIAAGGYWWWKQGGVMPEGFPLADRSAPENAESGTSSEASSVAALAVSGVPVDGDAGAPGPTSDDSTGPPTARTGSTGSGGADGRPALEPGLAAEDDDAARSASEKARDDGSAGVGESSEERSVAGGSGSGGSSSRGMGQRGDQGQDGDDDEPIVGQERIQGQVMLTDGTPVIGAAVSAVSVRLFTEDTFGAPSGGRSEGRARTGTGGRFAISGLAAGEYQLTAKGPATVPTETVSVVRSGSQDVRLILGQELDIWIDGYVVTREGVPLGDVAVQGGDQEVEAVSAADGTFGFSARMQSHRPLSLKLTREGYEDARASVDPAARNDHGVVSVDVRMSSALGSITVAGIVRDQNGVGLQGKTLHLSQGNTKYRATTDAGGGFAINGIRQEGSYVLSVPADGIHSGYQNLRFQVPDQGVRGQEIELTSVGVGTLQGQMVDIDGRPVPNFTLLVNSDSAPGETMTVTSDAQGNFVAAAVPEGKLRIQSQSFPRFVTSGLTMINGAILEAQAVLDLGGEDLRGKVLDEAGAPVSGADVTMSWVRREGGVLHESLRRSTTDRTGQFVFSQLGNEARDLIVRAPNFENGRLSEVLPSGAQSVDIQLQRAPN